MLHQIFVLLFSLKVLSCSCRHEIKEGDFLQGKKEFSVRKIARLPAVVSESSGIVPAEIPGNFWTINDSGGEPVLYQVSLKGELISEKKVENTKNIDWEDLTKDNQGNLFIGDFGNNAQNRKNLVIYKLSGNKVEAIKFKYKTQQFNHEEKRIYDCEAFFCLHDKLYLFSKDWSKKHFTYLYELPAIAGSYAIEPKAKAHLKAQITAAAISPDISEFALLAYGKIFFYGIKEGVINFESPKYCMKLAKKQAEALTYLDENTLLLTNEQGDIYQLMKKGVSK